MFLLLQLLINLTFYALHNRVHLVFYDKFICTPPPKKKKPECIPNLFVAYFF